MSEGDRTGLRERRTLEQGKGAGEGLWSSALVFRLACGVLGLACGVVLALLIAAIGAGTGNPFAGMQPLLVAGAIAGAAGGALLPEALLKTVVGLSYFLVSMLSAWGGGEPPEAPQKEGWLAACAAFGALYVVGLSVLWGLLH